MKSPVNTPSKDEKKCSPFNSYEYNPKKKGLKLLKDENHKCSKSVNIFLFSEWEWQHVPKT